MAQFNANCVAAFMTLEMPPIARNMIERVAKAMQQVLLAPWEAAGDRCLGSATRGTAETCGEWLACPRDMNAASGSSASDVCSLHHGCSYVVEVEIGKHSRGAAAGPIASIRQAVNQALGGFEGSDKASAPDGRGPPRLLLFVRNRRTLGCVLCEDVRTAHRLLVPPKTSGSSPRAGPGNERSSEYAPGMALRIDMTASIPVRMGIGQIWVHSSARRQGIASLLINASRRVAAKWTMHPMASSPLRHGVQDAQNDVASHHGIVSLQEIAFSHPTAEGFRFIRSFVGRQDFLVYS